MLTRGAESFADQRAEVAELTVLGARTRREREAGGGQGGGVRMGRGQYEGRRLAAETS